jgi:CRISPR/Cas system-associated endonuclease Cas1
MRNNILSWLGILAKKRKKKKGKREYLNDVRTKDFTAKLNDYFGTLVEIPRIKVGQRQTIETLINEEALLFAKYLRNEKRDWIPRVGITE